MKSIQYKISFLPLADYQLKSRDYLKFPYGQLALAAYDGKMENFVWDGLALIKRGESTYVNEPYVTGGNPILNGDKVLFNDILGTTLGVKSGENFAAIARDSFGETADRSHDNFFTGKPLIGELGYAFLFRNYRAAAGKWQTADPLGYPDSWNNFAYCNNQVTDCVDWLGGEIIVEGSDDFKKLANAVISAAQSSSTTLGTHINALVNHPGGGWFDGNSTTIIESKAWPQTQSNYTGSGATIYTGQYTYQYKDTAGIDRTRDAITALLHELEHAYQINVNGIIPQGDTDEQAINRLVAQLEAQISAQLVPIRNQFQLPPWIISPNPE